MSQDIITIINQAEQEAEKEVLVTQEQARNKISVKEKEMESRLINLEQSLGEDIKAIEVTAQKKLLEIKKEEEDKRTSFGQRTQRGDKKEVKKLILDLILKKLWLPK